MASSMVVQLVPKKNYFMEYCILMAQMEKFMAISSLAIVCRAFQKWEMIVIKKIFWGASGKHTHKFAMCFLPHCIKFC